MQIPWGGHEVPAILDLAGTGLSSARYVKVVSLQHVADIVRGPGSGFYPGAEIDAVGAATPGP